MDVQIVVIRLIVDGEYELGRRRSRYGAMDSTNH